MSSIDPVIDPLSQFVQSLEQVPDPRSPQGQSHLFPTILGVVFLGLLANQPKVLAKMKQVFADAPQREPDNTLPTKKKGLLRFVVCG
jgi:hypothetical protein